ALRVGRHVDRVLHGVAVGGPGAIGTGVGIAGNAPAELGHEVGIAGALDGLEAAAHLCLVGRIHLEARRAGEHGGTVDGGDGGNVGGGGRADGRLGHCGSNPVARTGRIMPEPRPEAKGPAEAGPSLVPDLPAGGYSRLPNSCSSMTNMLMKSR